MSAARSTSFILAEACVVATMSVIALAVVTLVRSKQPPQQEQEHRSHRAHRSPRAQQRHPTSPKATDDRTSAYEGLIGNTPLVLLDQLSSLLQRRIYIKMESMNPGGTGKDRAALSMIRAAEAAGALPPPVSAATRTTSWPKTTTTPTTRGNQTNEQPLPPPPLPNDSQMQQPYEHPSESSMDAAIQQALQHSRTGGLVVEGTSGSTGIALATLCASRGHACLVVLPDDQASEKQAILQTLQAVVQVVPNVAISNPQHYVHMARRVAIRAGAHFHIPAVFLNQFENDANFQIHYQQTGPELLTQCPDLDAFCMSAGTGGTLAGVARFLKEQKKRVWTVLIDPPGSALYHKVQHGVLYAPQQAERRLQRHRYDTLAEGIGLDRMTHNFALGCPYIDQAIRVTDQEAVDMAHWLLQTEGLWVGSSSSMNVVGAVRTALSLPIDSTVVTVGCDNGNRHLTRFWNRDFCRKWGLQWPRDDRANHVPECLRAVLCENRQQEPS